MSLSPESHRDPSDTRVATLATIGPDGRPQLSEVWFLGDGDSVALSLNTSRQKAKNLAAGPQCCLFVFDLDATQRYLELRGDALLVPDDDYAFADRVGQKYGADLRQHDGPNERPTGDRADHPPQGQRRRHARLSPGPRAGRPRLPGRSTATAGPVDRDCRAGRPCRDRRRRGVPGALYTGRQAGAVPERDLNQLLPALTVSRRPGSWCLVSRVDLDAETTVAAQVAEDEGTTSVILASDASRLGLVPDFVAAWLTLDVHSALDAVGLTAVVSTALAARGIPCNILAGVHHDHLLVPVDRAEEAMAALTALSSAPPA